MELAEILLIAFAGGVGVFATILGANSADIVVKVAGLVGGVAGILYAVVLIVD